MRLILLCVAVGVSGCATTYNAGWSHPEVTTAAEADATVKAAIEEGDALWAERGDKAKLQKAIDKWEAAAAQRVDAALFTKIARGHYLLADGFDALEGNFDQRDSEFQLGLDWATRALKAAAPELAKALAQGKTLASSAGLVTKDAATATYWYALTLGKWAGSRGVSTRLRYKDDINAAMEQVQRLDERFFYAGPYRYFGTFEAQTDGLAGGSLERSEQNFKKGVELAPDFLGTKVLWAEHLCVARKDKAAFRQLLDEVLAADAGVDPEIAVENRIEQQKAKRLLARIDDLF